MVDLVPGFYYLLSGFPVFMPLFLFGLWRKNIPFLALYSNHLSGSVLILSDFKNFLGIYLLLNIYLFDRTRS